MERWFLKQKYGDPQIISRRFGVSPLAARLILNRGTVDAEAFRRYLKADESCFHAPERLKDAEKLCTLLAEGIESGKKIRIIGDYDVDGITSTYIYYRLLRDLGARVDYVIPHRVLDGYGIHMGMITRAAEEGVDTILTCDTGISAREEVRAAREAGMTVLITDHHSVPYEETAEGRRELLPEADAVVDPKQENCPYPFPEICGAFVAYKIACLLCRKLGKTVPGEFLELAALATVCDVMELRDENRALVKLGLAAMQHSGNTGLQALIAQTAEGRLTAYHLGFLIGPCLNATGRLETAMEAMDLLLASDPSEAESLAVRLRELNEERKRMTQENLEQALEQAERDWAEDKVLVLYLPDCHESLAGIVAGRVKEARHRPVLVLTKGEKGVKGSGRSIEGYSMFEKLSEAAELLERFGGHPMAAGLSLKEENIGPLRSFLNEKCGLTEEDLCPRVSIDLELPPDQVSVRLIRELEVLEPYGCGNPKPLFAARGVRIRRAAVLGAAGTVLRLTFQEEAGKYWHTAVLFGAEQIAGWKEEMAGAFGTDAVERTLQGADGGLCMDLVYCPEINQYRDRESVQFRICHYRARK